VTGGSSGAGLAVAELAARRGAHVSLIARDADRLEAARESVMSVRELPAQRVSAYSADVSSWSAVSEAVHAAEEASGPVDVLVTGAGYCYPARFTEMPIEEFERQLGTNLLGTIYATRAAVPAMMKRGRGHVAMFSSMGGVVGVYGYSAYSPSKFGVMGFAEVMRCELKPHGIGVSVVCPPNIDSPGYARELEIEPPETARINRSSAMMSPHVVAEAVVDGIDRGRFLVVPGMANALVARFKSLVPGLLFSAFDRDVAAVRKAVTTDAA
jgi:3-dehydrosphinganine reductase